MSDETPYGRRQASVEYWSSHRNTVDELYPSERHFFVDCLRNSRSVLDVGCAAGGFSEICRAVVPEVEYCGLDVSENLVASARRTYENEHTTFYVYDGVSFPDAISERRFDLVFSFGVLHHVESWDVVLRQMLRAAGSFVCFDLRLNESGDLQGHQIIDFNEEWDGVTKIDYFVLDLYETLRAVSDMAGSERGVDLYGYECPPTDKAVIDIDKVTMASFCIGKRDGKPRLKLEVL